MQEHPDATWRARDHAAQYRPRAGHDGQDTKRRHRTHFCPGICQYVLKAHFEIKFRVLDRNN